MKLYLFNIFQEVWYARCIDRDILKLFLSDDTIPKLIVDNHFFNPTTIVLQDVATDCSLSLTTVRIRIQPAACEKVVNDTGLDAGLPNYPDFLSSNN